MTAERDGPVDWAARFLGEIPTAVALFDPEFRYIAASRPWIAAFGLGRARLAGRRHDELCKTGRHALAAAQRDALSGEPINDYHLVDDDGQPRAGPAILSARPHRDHAGAIAGVILALHEAPPGAADQAGPATDPLTGLPDRHQFARRLDECLADPDPARRAVVVFALNLDGFRTINALHGNATGDQVLRIIAERLVSGTRARHAGDDSIAGRGRDMIARLGGDEFGIICGPPALPPAEAEAFAARLPRMVQAPIAIGGHSLRVTAGIGFITTTPEHRAADDALRDLDLALRRAKALGPSRVFAWEPSLTRAAIRRYSLVEQVRRAFDNGEFVLHYQPVLRLSDSRLVGAEVLLRWNHPSEGLVASAAFLPLLEETGLIVEVGAWAVREAARHFDSWRMIYGRRIVEWVSVNLSARQLNDSSSLIAALRSVHESGFSMQRLKLEITEAALLRDPEKTSTVLAALAAIGVPIAIDDFGAGHAGLTGLGQHRADTIKIGAEFTAQIGSAAGDRLVQGLLEIARSHHAIILGQGIETAAQAEFLRAGGCTLGQGYLFAEPMAGARFGAYALTCAAAAEAEPAPPRQPSASRVLTPPSKNRLPAG